MTRTGYEGKYFCVTIEELMNKGINIIKLPMDDFIKSYEIIDDIFKLKEIR